MAGKFIKVKFITREFVRQNPDAIFVFGDNMQRIGYGGQAKAMRGEPNAIGVPTKWKPTNEPDAFFCDDDWPAVKNDICKDTYKIVCAAQEGKTIYVPEDGIGTGLSKLNVTAPRIFHTINSAIEYIERNFCE